MPADSMIARIPALLMALTAGILATSMALHLSPGLHALLDAMAPREPGAAPVARPAAAPEPLTPEGVLILSPERIVLARIEVAAVAGGSVGQRIAVPGTIVPAADRVARIPARVGGIVAELRKRLDDPVAQGEVVAVLDSREAADARSSYMTATVNFDLQRTLFDRAQLLRNSRVSSEQQYLQARASFEEAALQRDLALQNLMALGLDAARVTAAARDGAITQGASRFRQYEIRSPSAGRVVEQRVSLGTSVGQLNDPTDLYVIADLSRLWVEMAVAPVDLRLTRRGQRVAITGAGEGALRTVGEIIFVSPFFDPGTRTARVIAEFANPDEAWRPGSFVTAELLVEGAAAEVLIPRAAVQTIAGNPAVFVRTPEGFRVQPVTLGRAVESMVEVTKGLTPDERIAVANSFALKAELGRGQLQD